MGSLWLDIATARTEFYPYPAANPEVEASSIRQDLYRRDFTINALAVRLTTPRKGESSRKGDLLDFFGGLLDLRSRQIRVLHPNSFIEDPTRIYRAVRFAVRLGFEIEEQTAEYIRYAIDSGVYEKLRLGDKQRYDPADLHLRSSTQRVSAKERAPRPAPALTTRLRAELKHILQPDYWKAALQLLSDLGALRCLHQDLELTSKLWWEVRCISRWLRYLDPQNKLQHWLIRLEILIAHLPASTREKVATSLQLPKDSIQRVKQLEQIELEITAKLPDCHLASEIYKLLHPYKYLGLILLAVRTSQQNRNILWRYLTKLSKVQPILNGNDLKELGYKPGRQYKAMLEDLLTATLDKTITSRDAAEAFIKAKY